MRINLLPQEYRPQPLINPKRLFLMIISGVLALSSIGFAFFEYTSINANKRDLQSIKQQLTALESKKDLLQKVEALQQEIEKFKKEVKTIEGYYNQPVMLLDRMTAAMPEHIWLENLKLGTDGKIQIRAHTLDFVIISDLLDNLKKTGIFQEVKLLKIDEEKNEDSGLTTYSFEFMTDTGRKLEYAKK